MTLVYRKDQIDPKETANIELELEKMNIQTGSEISLHSTEWTRLTQKKNQTLDVKYRMDQIDPLDLLTISMEFRNLNLDAVPEQTDWEADEHDWLDRLLDDQGLGGDGGKAFLFGEEIYEHVMIDRMIVEGKRFKVGNDAFLLGDLIQGEIRSIRADLANLLDTRIIVASPCRDNNPLIVTGT